MVKSNRLRYVLNCFEGSPRIPVGLLCYFTCLDPRWYCKNNLWNRSYCKWCDDWRKRDATLPFGNQTWILEHAPFVDDFPVKSCHFQYSFWISRWSYVLPQDLVQMLRISPHCTFICAMFRTWCAQKTVGTSPSDGQKDHHTVIVSAQKLIARLNKS